MRTRLVELILNESLWFPTSFIAALAVTVWVVARGQRGSRPRVQTSSLTSLFYGCLIAMMGFGHLLAVTVKLFQGTLQGPLLLLYPIGLALTLPAAWLAAHQLTTDGRPATSRTTLGLNLWLAIALPAFGPANWPLAVLALLNIAHRLELRRALGRALVGVTVVAYLALFAGSLVFLTSGQSFEEFSSLE